MRDDTHRDIEETEEKLDFNEGDSVEFWEKKQRELVSSVVDYNLGTLAELVETGTINLSPKYQRRFRWDVHRQSRLIESFLMNVPVPPIFLNEDNYGQYSVIDGKQRLFSIVDFLSGRLELSGLEVFSDINGLTIRELPTRLQSVLKTRPTLRAIIILRQSDQDVKFEVFQRLNTGGVRLNPQEIRNSTYPGPLNDLLLELSECRQFHTLLGIRNKTKSAIYQEMRDAEFVLRYFTFCQTWNSFKGGSMKRMMDNFMYDHQRMSNQQLASMKTDFLNAIQVVKGAFGDHAFRRWEEDKGRWRRQVIASLYDAQMFGCIGFRMEDLEPHQEALIARLKLLFSDDEFTKAIGAATNNVGNFRTRIKKINALVSNVVGG